MARRLLCFYKGQPLGFQPVGPQHRQHLRQPFRPVAEGKASAVLQQTEGAPAHIVQCAGILVPGKGVGRIPALGSIREVGRIARTHVKTALALPEGAQVGTDRREMPDVLFFHRSRKQGAALRLQLQPDAGAPVAPVVPFQRHDAAAGAQVCGLLGTLRLTKRASSSASEPKRCSGEQYTIVLLYKTSVECSIDKCA